MPELKFGTAGLRGIMGPAEGQINIQTIKRASYAVAAWIEGRRRAESAQAKTPEDALAAKIRQRLVVIARDSRIDSDVFALETAKALEASGVRALSFSDIVPVPALSFAVRYLKADAGVMITASHNAKEYNGYKVYGPDGAQILPGDAAVIQQAISQVSRERMKVEWEKFKPAYVPKAVYEAYYQAMKEASGFEEPASGSGITAEIAAGEAESPQRPLRVIYSPLNGSGRMFVQRVLAEDGFEVFTVPEQEMPDGNFTTCGQPNPEFASVYELAIRYAREREAAGAGPDLLVATDPDCDRVGAMARAKDGSWQLLTGNDLGLLVLSYLGACRDLTGKTFISSFVSTPLGDRLAESLGMRVEKTPVGFKHIAAGIERLQEDFGFAFEESNGMLAGTYTRDKDGVLGARLICRAADWCRRRGTTLLEELARLNAVFGPVFSRTIDVPADPEAPNPETSIRDLPDGSRVVVRPSGTEPKIKHYFFAPTPERLEELIGETLGSAAF
ncbi:MAG: phospho-sugar mutase [Clostridia bacterium]|nr:phospho-sugar mutase [Clostridia bacterium]